MREGTAGRHAPGGKSTSGGQDIGAHVIDVTASAVKAPRDRLSGPPAARRSVGADLRSASDRLWSKE
ncbi:hypothetical protein ME121_0273 [Methylobacterium sp. ME121]|nr:hypothetical protein ME121_0273 [Methylobacterium sp. ME121]